MKKIVTLLATMIFLLTGCYFSGSNLSWKEEAQKLVVAFDNQNVESVKSLFAKDINEKTNLYRQIEEAFNFYNSKSINTEFNNVSGSYQKDDIDYSVEDVEVKIKTKNTTFIFMLAICTEHTDSKLVGIRELTISKENDSDSFVFVGNSDIKF